MKQVSFFLFLLFVIQVGCSKSDTENVSTVEVDNYILKLREGNYSYSDLPDFNSSHIAALLKYRNDNQIIKNFPRNPISSFYMPECKLGVYVLWTIESIRAVSIHSERLVMRFPSLNPSFRYTHSGESIFGSDSLVNATAAQAYFQWWEANKLRSFNEFKSLNPLETTIYCWH